MLLAMPVQADSASQPGAFRAQGFIRIEFYMPSGETNRGDFFEFSVDYSNSFWKIEAMQANGCKSIAVNNRSSSAVLLDDALRLESAPTRTTPVVDLPMAATVRDVAYPV